jgi:hypothetical protein
MSPDNTAPLRTVGDPADVAVALQRGPMLEKSNSSGNDLA